MFCSKCHFLNKIMLTSNFCAKNRNLAIRIITKRNLVIRMESEKFIKIETGKLARFADGSATAQQGNTTVLVTAIGKQLYAKPAFQAMTVDYRHKAAAAGQIPSNFLRRELGPSDLETLTSRVIDRSLRPLFPKNSWVETYITCNVLAMDADSDPDIMAINAASAALTVSHIPWNGPVGAVRVGYVEDDFVINPNKEEKKNSMLDLIVTGASNNRIIMLESCANNLKYDLFKKAIQFGMSRVSRIVKEIESLSSQGKKKIALQIPEDMSESLLKNQVISLCSGRLKGIYTDTSHDKISRDVAIAQVKEDVKAEIVKTYKVLGEKGIIKKVQDAEEIFDNTFKEIFRDMTFEGTRCDGRELTDIRHISSEVGLLKPLHGSALFQRGQTQVLCSVTLDSLDTAQKMDQMTQLLKGQMKKNFMLHYEFPAYAINEIKQKGTTSRREIGHGNLAERGLKAVIPEDYNFTIRLTSEVLESNGSSSMASVCGGSLALMEAGVPISSHVAGVAIGLMTKVDENNPTTIKDFRILTDLMGIEDYLGDMDFKIAGTLTGITALQVDIKVEGINMEIIRDAIFNGRCAIRTIIGKMNSSISTPKVDKPGPVTEDFDIPASKISKLVGFGGLNLRRIEREAGVKITVVNGTVFSVFAPSTKNMLEAKVLIESELQSHREAELEFNQIYSLKVKELLPMGISAEVDPRYPPIFISNRYLTDRRIHHSEATGFKVGEIIQAQYFGRDPVTGAARFSRKSLIASASGLKKSVFNLSRDENTKR